MLKFFEKLLRHRSKKVEVPIVLDKMPEEKSNKCGCETCTCDDGCSDNAGCKCNDGHKDQNNARKLSDEMPKAKIPRLKRSE